MTIFCLCPLLYGLQREKTCLRGFANNTGADQPAHSRSLISAFVIRFLESIICNLLQMKFQQGSHEHWKTWKITKKSSMHGKIMEFEKY